MAKSDTVVDEDAKSVDVGSQEASAKRRTPKAVKIGAVVLLGGAIFAGGMFAAGQFGGGDDEAAATLDSFATGQLVDYLSTGDQIIVDAQAAKEGEVLQQKGIELQALAVGMEALIPQFSDPELRDAAQLLADGYLDISIGLITNNGAKTTAGADTLNEGRDKLVAVLGTETGTEGDAGDQPQQDGTTDQQEPTE